MMQQFKAALEASPLVCKVREWYGQQTKKDQCIVLSLCALIFFCFLYLVIIAPLYGWSAQRYDAYKINVETTVWMHKHLGGDFTKDTIVSGGKEGVASASVMIADIAKQTGVSIERIQSNRAGISVWLNTSEYKKVVSWLLMLYKKDHIIVQRIKLSAVNKQGWVSGMLVLNHT